MSLRYIARDLYRLQQQVYRLEKELIEAPFADRVALKSKLRKAIAERNLVKRMLDGRLDR